MKSLANLLAFKVVWIAAVEGAARGSMWLGPAALAAVLPVHLAAVSGGRERLRELGYLLAVGLLGTATDSALKGLAVTTYPTSLAAWPHALVPPWIVALWVGFAMLPRFSLAWLSRRPWWVAALLGAAGGPFSFFCGTRFGSIAPGQPLWTWIFLAVEYAVALPLLLRLAPSRRSSRARGEGRLRPARSLFAKNVAASPRAE